MGADPKTYGGDLLNFSTASTILIDPKTDGVCFELAQHFQSLQHIYNEQRLHKCALLGMGPVSRSRHPYPRVQTL